jgi:7SK snRNA methylphosphate capping enzyme
LETDPRLAALDEAWFQGKRGLDIGCNSGEFTITVAKRLAPSYLLGVDVDPQLVSRARGHLKDILRQHQIEKAFGEIPAVKDSIKTEGEAATADGNANERLEKEAPKEIKEGVSEKNGDGDAFANDMPLSFKLWKPSMQSQASVPRAIGKAAIGCAIELHLTWRWFF